MNELKDILNKKLKELETIQKSCEKKLRYAPKGSIYAIKNKNDSNKLMNLLSEIPLEYIQVSNEIISYAKY